MSTTNEPALKRKRENSPVAENAVAEAKERDEVFAKVVTDGDVIFVFDNGSKRLQLQRRFDAPRGRPGQTTYRDPLPEDDFEAMKLVCLVIHNPGQTKMHAPDVDKLAQIYEVANKYDLVNIISLSFEFWVQNLSQRESQNLKGLWLLMFLSYEMKAHAMFQHLSKCIIYSNGFSFMPYAAHSEAKIGHLVPENLHYKLAANY
ncbi:hypothetical protein FGRMN_4666 [Fusarium graminum]|nr:hypothetical protein FGRMN_4666 [Fusarium graminum]